MRLHVGRPRATRSFLSRRTLEKEPQQSGRKLEEPKARYKSTLILPPSLACSSFCLDAQLALSRQRTPTWLAVLGGWLPRGAKHPPSAVNPRHAVTFDARRPETYVDPIYGHYTTCQPGMNGARGRPRKRLHP